MSYITSLEVIKTTLFTVTPSPSTVFIASTQTSLIYLTSTSSVSHTISALPAITFASRKGICREANDPTCLSIVTSTTQTVFEPVKTASPFATVTALAEDISGETISTSDPTSDPTPSISDSEMRRIEGLLGGVLGGFAFICLLVALYFYFRSRRRAKIKSILPIIESKRGSRILPPELDGRGRIVVFEIDHDARHKIHELGGKPLNKAPNWLRLDDSYESEGPGSHSEGHGRLRSGSLGIWELLNRQDVQPAVNT